MFAFLHNFLKEDQKGKKNLLYNFFNLDLTEEAANYEGPEDIYKKNDHIYFVGRKEDIDDIQKMAGKPSFDVKNVMILGSGKIGRLLAKALQFDYNVKIVEKNKEKAKN